MSFENLNLILPLQKAISEEGYITPTPIQEQSIPHLLNGRDILGIAQTGTGKTASFILPILQNMSQTRIKTVSGTPKVLVIAPTRELAAQIGDSFSAYGKYTRFKHTVIFGGVGQQEQVKALRKGVDSLIATPGRLLDLADQGHVRLSEVEYFVLDEADRMLDMGFINDIYKILSLLPKKRQSLFFSATISPEISKLARTMLTNPVTVEVSPQATTVERIEQFIFFIDAENKNNLLLQLLQSKHLKSVLVFTRTKYRANKVAELLNKNRIPADAIHGNKSQTHRIKTLQGFRDGQLRVLVATDIAARGLDIENISHVINYDLPNIPESYVHRIGRTARAGADGTAFSFCAAEERSFLQDIEKLIRMKIEVAEHDYHSEQAKNAAGDDAKPAPGKQRGRKRQKTNPDSPGNRGEKKSRIKGQEKNKSKKNTKAVQPAFLKTGHTAAVKNRGEKRPAFADRKKSRDK